MSVRSASAALIALLAAGCSSSPPPKDPPSGAVTAFPEESAEPAASAPPAASAAPPAPPQPPPERIAPPEPAPENADAPKPVAAPGPEPLTEAEQKEADKKCKPLTKAIDAKKKGKAEGSDLDLLHEVLKKPPKMRKPDLERCTELLERKLAQGAPAPAEGTAP